MNYRHAYHAGNFADVLKHVVLALVIEHLKRKPAPFRIIDTHADDRGLCARRRRCLRVDRGGSENGHHGRHQRVHEDAADGAAGGHHAEDRAE